MFTIRKKYFGTIALMMLMVVATAITSCKDDDEASQSYNFLESFGPCPVARGGELTFLGADLRSVQSVEFPGGETVTPSFNGNGKFTVTVPESAQPGVLILHTSNGDIKTLTPIDFTEPVVVSDFSPKEQRPGNEVSIKGKYLSNATYITIGNVKIPLQPSSTEQTATFEKYVTSLTNDEIKFIVPAEAATGDLALVDGQPVVAGTLTVTLPTFTSWSKSEGLLPGSDEVVINGTDLDLISKVTFANGTVVESDDIKNSVKKSSVNSISFVLPLTAGDGAVTLTTISGIDVEAGSISVVKPEVTSFGSDNEYPYCDDLLFIKGTNLQLIKEVIVANKADNVQTVSTFTSASETEIQFAVPEGTGSSMVWNNDKQANVPNGELYIITQSGKRIQVSTEENKLQIGWANIGSADNYSITAGDKVVMTNCTNTAYMTKIEADGLEVEFTKDSKNSYSFVWPLTKPGSNLILKVYYSNGDENSNEWGDKFQVAASTLPYVLVAPTEKIAQGGTIILQGGNFDKITKITCGTVELNDFTSSADGTKLYIEVPLTFKATVSALDLIIDDTHKSQTPLLTIGDPEVVLWEGSWEKTNDWNGFEGLSWGNIPAAFKNIHVGDEFRVYAENNGNWIQCGFRLADGWADKFSDGTDCQMQQDQLSADGYFSWTITQQMLDEWKVDTNGIIIYFNGDNYLLKKITYIAK